MVDVNKIWIKSLTLKTGKYNFYSLLRDNFLIKNKKLKVKKQSVAHYLDLDSQRKNLTESTALTLILYNY